MATSIFDDDVEGLPRGISPRGTIEPIRLVR
jgi:hypothetical protein